MGHSKAISSAICFVLSIPILSNTVTAASAPRDSDAGRVTATQVGDKFQLENRTIGARWSVSNGKVNGLSVMDRIRRTEIRVATPFAILLKDGTIYDTDALELIGQPTMEE